MCSITCINYTLKCFVGGGKWGIAESTRLLSAISYVIYEIEQGQFGSDENISYANCNDYTLSYSNAKFQSTFST